MPERLKWLPATKTKLRLLVIQAQAERRSRDWIAEQMGLRRPQVVAQMTKMDLKLGFRHGRPPKDKAKPRRWKRPVRAEEPFAPEQAPKQLNDDAFVRALVMEGQRLGLLRIVEG